MKKRFNNLKLLAFIVSTMGFTQVFALSQQNVESYIPEYCDLDELQYAAAKNKLLNEYVCPDFKNGTINISEFVFNLEQGKVSPEIRELSVTDYSNLREKVCSNSNFPQAITYLNLTEDEQARINTFATNVKERFQPEFQKLEDEVLAVPYKVNELLNLQNEEMITMDNIEIQGKLVNSPKYSQEDDIPLQLRTDGQYFNSNRYDQIMVGGFCSRPANTATIDDPQGISSCLRNNDGKYPVNLGNENIAFFFHDKIEIRDLLEQRESNARGTRRRWWQRRQNYVSQYLRTAKNDRYSEIVKEIKNYSSRAGGKNLDLTSIKSFCSTSPIDPANRERNEGVLSLVRKYIDLKGKGRRLKAFLGGDQFKVVNKMNGAIEDIKEVGFGKCAPQRGAAVLNYTVDTNSNGDLMNAPLRLPRTAAQRVLNTAALLDMFNRIGKLEDKYKKIFQAIYEVAQDGSVRFGFQVKHDRLLTKLNSLGFDTKKMENGKQVDKTANDIAEDINTAFFDIMPYACQVADYSADPDKKLAMGIHGSASMEAAKRLFYSVMKMMKVEGNNYAGFSKLYTANLKDILDRKNSGLIKDSTTLSQIGHVPLEFSSQAITYAERKRMLEIDNISEFNEVQLTGLRKLGPPGVEVSIYDYVKGNVGYASLGGILASIHGDTFGTDQHKINTNIFNNGIRMFLQPHIFTAKEEGDKSKQLGSYTTLVHPSFKPQGSRSYTSALNCFSVAQGYVWLYNNKYEATEGLIRSENFSIFKSPKKYGKLEIKDGKVKKSIFKFTHIADEHKGKIEKTYDKYAAYLDVKEGESRYGFIDPKSGAGVAFKEATHDWSRLPTPMRVIKESDLNKKENDHLVQKREAYRYIKSRYNQKKAMYEYVSAVKTKDFAFERIEENKGYSAIPFYYAQFVEDYYKMRVYLDKHYKRNDKQWKKSDNDFLLMGETKSPHAYVIANCNACECLNSNDKMITALKSAKMINLYDDYKNVKLDGQNRYLSTYLSSTDSSINKSCIFTPLVPHSDFIAADRATRVVASGIAGGQKNIQYDSCKPVQYLRQRFAKVWSNNREDLIVKNDEVAKAKVEYCFKKNTSIAYSSENLNKNNGPKKCGEIEGLE